MRSELVCVDTTFAMGFAIYGTALIIRRVYEECNSYVVGGGKIPFNSYHEVAVRYALHLFKNNIITPLAPAFTAAILPADASQVPFLEAMRTVQSPTGKYVGAARPLPFRNHPPHQRQLRTRLLLISPLSATTTSFPRAVKHSSRSLPLHLHNLHLLAV